jgi:predicted dehydrogenase
VEKQYAEKTPNFRCAEYEDFRVMLEKEKAIDAVLCATPDHLHACVAVAAMRQGTNAAKPESVEAMIRGSYRKGWEIA